MPEQSLQLTEPAIAEARKNILWSDHIVFFFPVWWGTVPALLKGFIDRVFIKGFAFREIEGGIGYAPLLTGRSSRLIDTPYLLYKFIYGAPVQKAMKECLLRFCGIAMLSTLHFGPVKTSSLSQRKKWIEKVKKTGNKLGQHPFPFLLSLRIRSGHWLKAVRLQFYPMTFLAYWLGANAAKLSGLSFKTSIFWL
jgi:1,4-dihydroxy-2-naphthoate polyprenyltransferase